MMFEGRITSIGEEKLIMIPKNVEIETNQRVLVNIDDEDSPVIKALHISTQEIKDELRKGWS